MSRARLVWAALAVGGLVLVVVVASLALPMRKTRDVDVPAPGASPTLVASTYLDAVAAHDCYTAKALLVADPGPEASFCGSVKRLSKVRVGDPRPEDASAWQRSASTQVVSLTVDFDVTWRVFREDPSFGDDRVSSGMALAFDDRSEAWKVIGFGE